MVQLVNAMSFIPTSTTLSEQKYETIAGRIKFKLGETGQLTFVCPLPSVQQYKNDKNGGITMELRYYRELRASQASVSVVLRRYSLITGNVQTVLQMDTDNENPPGPSGQSNYFAKIEASRNAILNMSKYGYYFQITLKRNEIAFSEPDDAGGGTPEELNVGVLDLRIFGYGYI